MALRKVRNRGKSSVVPLIVVSVIVLGLGGAVAMMFSGAGGGLGGRSRQSARQTATLSNVKQVALAALMYSADWDNRFPLGMSNQRDSQRVLMPYTRNSSLFRSLNPAGGMIEPNPNLAGVPAGGLKAPSVTIMMFETYDWSDGRRAVAFTDGHAKRIEGFDAATDLEVGLSEGAQAIVDELALELERSAAAPAASLPASGPLGMPRG